MHEREVMMFGKHLSVHEILAGVINLQQHQCGISAALD